MPYIYYNSWVDYEDCTYYDSYIGYKDCACHKGCGAGHKDLVYHENDCVGYEDQKDEKSEG